MLTKNKGPLRFPGIYGELLVSLMRGGILLTRMHDRFFRQRGLTESQFFTLMAVYYSLDGRLSFSALGRLLIVSRANISGLIVRLEEKGLVQRVPDDHDRRVVYAELSASGRRIIERMLPDYRKTVKSIFSDMSEKKQRELLGLLALLRLESGKTTKGKTTESRLA